MEALMSSVPLWIWIGLGTLLVVVGLVGTVLPALPGNGLIFIGLLIIAASSHFTVVSVATMVWIGILALLAWLAEYAAGVLGAKKVGASSLALFGAAAGTLMGALGGFVGLFVGTFAGAMIGELIARYREHSLTDLGQGTRVGVAATMGILVAIVAKVAIAFIMMGSFLLAYWM